MESFSGKTMVKLVGKLSILLGKAENQYPAISNSMTELEKEINTLRSGLRAVETVSIL